MPDDVALGRTLMSSTDETRLRSLDDGPKKPILTSIPTVGVSDQYDGSSVVDPFHEEQSTDDFDLSFDNFGDFHNSASSLEERALATFGNVQVMKREDGKLSVEDAKEQWSKNGYKKSAKAKLVCMFNKVAPEDHDGEFFHAFKQASQRLLEIEHSDGEDEDDGKASIAFDDYDEDTVSIIFDDENDLFDLEVLTLLRELSPVELARYLVQMHLTGQDMHGSHEKSRKLSRRSPGDKRSKHKKSKDKRDDGNKHHQTGDSNKHRHHSRRRSADGERRHKRKSTTTSTNIRSGPHSSSSKKAADKRSSTRSPISNDERKSQKTSSKSSRDKPKSPHAVPPAA
jgi:hypothetical protein